VNNTGNKYVRIMKQTAFWRGKNGEYIPTTEYSIRQIQTFQKRFQKGKYFDFENFYCLWTFMANNHKKRKYIYD